MRTAALVASLFFAAVVFGQAPASWPKDVPVPAKLKPYTPATVVQRIAITDGRASHRWYRLDQHDHFANAPTLFNPNSKAPWQVSGGMEGLSGWKSIKLTNVSKESVAVRSVGIPISGAGQDLPGFRWSYPDGALFADLLVNNDGRAFELRVREKVAGKWVSTIAFEDDAAAPKGYKGAGRCATCHDKAGDSQQYGIMIRGNDGCFSFLPPIK